MRQKFLSLSLGLCILLLVQLACSTGVNIPVTGPDAVGTAAYATVGAQMTQKAFNDLVLQLTQAAMDTLTPEAPTATATATSTVTATATATWTATPTNTPVPPTATFTNTPIPPTATPIPCYRAQFIADVTVPDGTTYTANQGFVKTWRLRNAGSCTWTPDFDLVFVSGNVMGAAAAVDTNATVYPGQTVDYSVSFVAPSSSGSYQGNWELRSPNGIIFALGPNGDRPFWVKINVQGSSSSGNWDGDHKGEFTYAFCSASWSTGAGAQPCPGGSENFSSGAILSRSNPKLEGGYQEDENAILTIPSGGDGGTITGTYPALKVESGQSFSAMIGCLDNSPKCNATLQLNYSVDGGAVQNLGTWTETSDGTFHHVSLDLSSLVGKTVQFSLKVNNNGDSTDDRIFWIAAMVK